MDPAMGIPPGCGLGLMSSELQDWVNLICNIQTKGSADDATYLNP